MFWAFKVTGAKFGIFYLILNDKNETTSAIIDIQSKPIMVPDAMFKDIEEHILSI